MTREEMQEQLKAIAAGLNERANDLWEKGGFDPCNEALWAEYRHVSSAQYALWNASKHLAAMHDRALKATVAHTTHKGDR